MDIFFGPSGSGKTTELLKLAHRSPYIIVTMSKQRAYFLYKESLSSDLSIYYPITYTELLHNSVIHEGSRIQGFLFDDVEQFLHLISNGKAVRAMTFSAPVKGEVHGAS